MKTRRFKLLPKMGAHYENGKRHTDKRGENIVESTKDLCASFPDKFKELGKASDKVEAPKEPEPETETPATEETASTDDLTVTKRGNKKWDVVNAEGDVLNNSFFKTKKGAEEWIDAGMPAEDSED